MCAGSAHAKKASTKGQHLNEQEAVICRQAAALCQCKAGVFVGVVGTGCESQAPVTVNLPV